MESSPPTRSLTRRFWQALDLLSDRCLAYVVASLISDIAIRLFSANNDHHHQRKRPLFTSSATTRRSNKIKSNTSQGKRRWEMNLTTTEQEFNIIDRQSSNNSSNNSNMSSTPSKLKCVPLKPPLPSKFQGDLDKVLCTPVPEFASLANFPVHETNNSSVDLPDGMRCCVMCGQACLCGKTGKSKKGSGAVESLSPRNGNTQDYDISKSSSNGAIIPTQNKGLCTLCDVNVWVVVTSGLEIKWCKGCKNFRPWAAFGDKGLATKCLRCRERQKEKYRLQKEEKEYAQAASRGVTTSTGLLKK
jgi:hypothetical protein